MAVMIPRETTTTDQRLDSLEVKVGTVETKVDNLDQKFDERFKQVDDRLNRIEGRFDAFLRAQWQVGGMIFAALLGVIATQL
jgi:tetrahydromethanopterin S-methyltransferase subunit G